MAAAAAVSVVTGAADTKTTLSAASASNVVVLLRNESGVPVELYLDDQTQYTDVVPPVRFANQHVYILNAESSQLKVEGKAQGGALRVIVSVITA